MNRILSAVEGHPSQSWDTPNVLWQGFCARVQAHPEAVALRGEEGLVTYAALLAQAREASAALHGAGVRGQCRVGLHLPKGQVLLSYALACWHLGAALTFLPMDEPDAEITARVEAARLAFRVSGDAGLQRVRGLPGSWISSLDAQGRTASDGAGHDAQGGRLAVIAFTSGSTGNAKRVGLGDAGLLAVVSALIGHYRLAPGARLAWTSALSFDSAIAEVLLCLLSGACLVLPPSPRVLVGERLEALVREQALTHLIVTPSILETASPERFPAPLKIALVGEPLGREVIRRWCGNRTLFNAYGPCEASICATISGPLQAGSPVTVGTPLNGVEVRIVGPTLELLPSGERGEIAIGGAGLSLGYLDQPALSAQRFVSLPGCSGTYYLSGDLGHLTEGGELVLAGRNDDQVKINGRRIDLQALQDPLTEHPAIVRACAARHAAADGRYVLAAYLQLASGADRITPRALREHLLPRVPGHMIPTRWFVTSALPLTANGKTDRRALEDHVLYELEHRPGALPETARERTIAAVFSQVLGVERVGREDDFFALGASSVDSIRAVDLLKRALGEAMTFETFMRNPSVAQLADVAQAAAVAAAPVAFAGVPERYALYPSHGVAPETLFLTGASGFLGKAILERLASRDNTTVIVAGRHPRASVDSASTPTVGARQVALGFDLEQPLSAQAEALLETADCLIHCAARVNLAYDHSVLYPANVQATQRLLRASATGRAKRFAYLSSRSAVDVHDASGYASTKREAERQVFDAFSRGLAGHVYRPGRITGHSVTGRHNPNDFMVRFITACLLLERYPAGITQFSGIPVDSLAAQVVASILGETTEQALVEPADTEHYPLEQLYGFVTQAGLVMQAVSLQRWAALAADHPLVARLYPDILIAMTRHAEVMLVSYGTASSPVPAADAERVRRLAMHALDTHDSLVKGPRT